jgi:hypothetical protein
MSSIDSPASQSAVEAVAESVGFAISHWGKVEQTACSIFEVTLRTPRPQSARDAFYSIISFHGKMRAVDACFRREFKNDPGLIKDWAAFKKSALKVNTSRNELAHGTILTLNTDPPTIGWFPFWNGSQLENTVVWDGHHLVITDRAKLKWYAFTDIREIRNNFEDVHKQGQALLAKVYGGLKAEERTT